MQSTTPAVPADGDHILLVGQDRAGHWVVQETQGLLEGLFIDREAALRFARAERRHFTNGRVELASMPLHSLLAA